MNGDTSCLPAYTKASNKKTGSGAIRDAGAIDDFLSTWTQPDDAGDSHTTRRKGQGNKRRKHQGNASSEEKGAEGNSKKKKRRGQGNKRKHDKDSTGAQGNTNTGSGEQSPNNHKTSSGNKGQAGQHSDGLYNAQHDHEHKQNVGMIKKHNKRKYVKNKDTGGMTHIENDSVEGLSEEGDWSNIPMALKGIAQIILQEADMNN